MGTSLEDLRQLIRTCPIIDNHGHNILRPRQLKAANLLTITTEAGGEALKDATTSLAHLRALKQLRRLYELPDTASWDDVCRRRLELLDLDPDKLFAKCFEGTHSILIDDGLDSGANVHPYTWHDQYTTASCKRIVRIEAVAADLLSSMRQKGSLPVGVAVADEKACSLAWVEFIAMFEGAIMAFLEDPEVVGFKSVICYRTGLSVKTGTDIEVTENGLRSFRRHFLLDAVTRNFRVESKGMNDALVISTCKLIAAHHRTAKPLQFHTGLGDNDISLLDSDPARLQPLIKEFPTVPIVLLHSSYPYVRQAGYLATVYNNVYLDIGEVFPMVSRDGQETILRHALELTPHSKLLWSTDGHFFPETYWLANVQGRAALEKILCEYVEAGDLTIDEASQAVKDFFFNNSNALYDLRLSLNEVNEASDHLHAVSTQPDSSHYTHSRNIRGLDSAEYFIVQWLDFLGTIRSRWLPKNEFNKLVKKGGRLGISTGNLGTTQNDHFTPVVNPIGQIMVEPDLGSLKMMPKDKRSGNTACPALATVMASFTDEDGSPLKLCPRSELNRLSTAFREDYHIELLIGFEIEISFLRLTHKEEPFEPLDDHSWGSFSDRQYVRALPLVFRISEALKAMGIELQYLHSEAASGQYEFVLPPLPPLQAVDTLYQARQCIQQLAGLSSLRATCHPLPFPGIGTAAHAHISLNPDRDSTITEQELDGLNRSFVATILQHLPALCAFTMPQAVSYGRVVDDGWTGGTWIGWGTQNREVPLRKVLGAVPRWEVRCLDGFANMYLALSAILAAGLDGVRKAAVLDLQDCQDNPSALSEPRRRELGMTRRMPSSFDEALLALEQDEQLQSLISPGMAVHYATMKKSEQNMLNQMSEKERRVFLIERY